MTHVFSGGDTWLPHDLFGDLRRSPGHLPPPMLWQMRRVSCIAISTPYATPALADTSARWTVIWFCFLGQRAYRCSPRIRLAAPARLQLSTNALITSWTCPCGDVPAEGCTALRIMHSCALTSLQAAHADTSHAARSWVRLAFAVLPDCRYIPAKGRAATAAAAQSALLRNLTGRRRRSARPRRKRLRSPHTAPALKI